MDRDTRRFTIYVPRELSQNLAAARREVYQGRSQSDMLRDLIARGLRRANGAPRDPCDGVPGKFSSYGI